MPYKPEISVILAVKNGEATVVASLRSILFQTFEDFEIIVIDDGSTDNSLELIRSLDDPRIRICVNPENIGLAASLNRGIDLAAGRFIARMDADDIAYPERFELQYSRLCQDDSIDVLGTAALMFRGNEQCIGILPIVEHDLDIKRLGARGSFPLYHPTWMAKAEWFRRHRYNPTFRKSEDFELLLRASLTSRYANLPDVCLGYRYEITGSLAKRNSYRLYTWRAMRVKFAKSRQWPDLLAGGAVTAAKCARDVWLTMQSGGRDRDLSRVSAGSGDQLTRWREVCRLVYGDHSGP